MRACFRLFQDGPVVGEGPGAVAALGAQDAAN
jgi:hypothetical protein